MPIDWFAVFGCLSLGVFIGLLVRHYVQDRASFVAAGALVLIGLSVLAVFRYAAGQAGHEYWLYPVGLFFGFVLSGTTKK